MTNNLSAFRVREATLLLMVRGMMMAGFRQACHNSVRPLIVGLEDGTDVTGAALYDKYVHLCSDYKEDQHG